MKKSESQKKLSKAELVQKYGNFMYEQLRNETILVSWRKKGFSLRLVNENILDDLESKEEFIDTAFFILKNARSYMEEKSIDEAYVEYIKKLIDNVPYLKNNFMVYKSSGSYILEEYDYEILTKRDNEDINNVVGYSSQVSLNATHSNDSDKMKTMTFEISSHDLDKLISKLIEAKEKIDLLSK